MFTKIIASLVIGWQSFWARQAGGGDVGVWLDELVIRGKNIDLSWLSELFFTLPIALVCGLHFGWIAFFLAWAWSYIWYQTSHAVAFDMGNDPSVAQSGRKGRLSPIVDPICEKFNIELGTTVYCWIYMTLKGLLFCLPLLWFAPLAAVLYPLGYVLGNKYPLPLEWNTFSGEWYHGAIVGLVTTLAIVFAIV